MNKYKISLMIANGVLLAGCLNRPQHNPEEVVEQSYVHRYGVPVPADTWSSKGETGKVVSTLKNGVVVSRNYSNGILEGDTTYTFPHSDATEKVETYSQGQLQKERYFYKSGSPSKEIDHPQETTQVVKCFYEHGAPQSTETYENESLSRGEYYTPTHVTDSSVENGTGLRTRRDRFGLLVGVDTVQNGTIRETRTYYQDGSLRQIIPYQEGVVQGELRTFLPGGEPESIQTWTAGEQTGNTTFFENGEKVAVISMNKGVKNGVERRFRNGEILVEEISWQEDVRHGPTTAMINGITKTDYFFKGQPVTRSAYEKLSLGNRPLPARTY